MLAYIFGIRTIDDSEIIWKNLWNFLWIKKNYFSLLYTIAAGQNFESDDGLQKAIKRLQSAAGIFAHLKETSVGAIQRDPTPDLDPDTLGILAGNCEITDFFNVIIREMGKELIFKK